MKLVYLAHVRLPSQRAHAYQILQMCEAFADLGVEVSLFTVRGHGADIREAYDIRPVFETEGLFSLDLAPLGGWLPRPLREVWWRLAWGASLLTFSLAAAVRLRHRADTVFYSRDAFPLWSLARLWRGRARRMFFEAHTAPTSTPGRWLRHRLAADIGGFVTVTEHLRRRHEMMSIRPAQCIVAHDGVRLSRFPTANNRATARRRVGWPSEAFVVGYVGRTRTLGEDKGLPVLLHAVETLARRYAPQSMRCAIVGASDPEVKGLLSKWGPSAVHDDLLLATGWVNPTDVPLHLRAMDVCVLPLPWTEHFAFEASPLKLFEYMASGTPIVASNLPSIAEILRDGENALLVPPSDINALAEAMGWLRSHPALGKKLAAQAAQDVQHFSWHARARRIIEMMTGPAD